MTLVVLKKVSHVLKGSKGTLITVKTKYWTCIHGHIHVVLYTHHMYMYMYTGISYSPLVAIYIGITTHTMRDRIVMITETIIEIRYHNFMETALHMKIDMYMHTPHHNSFLKTSEIKDIVKSYPCAGITYIACTIIHMSDLSRKVGLLHLLNN